MTLCTRVASPPKKKGKFGNPPIKSRYLIIIYSIAKSWFMVCRRVKNSLPPTPQFFKDINISIPKTPFYHLTLIFSTFSFRFWWTAESSIYVIKKINNPDVFFNLKNFLKLFGRKFSQLWDVGRVAA